MNLVNRFVEIQTRQYVLNRACRHLLDHVTPRTSRQAMYDEDAVFILMHAMDGPEPDRCEFEEYYSDVDAKVCNQPAVGSDRESERDYCKKHLDWIGNEG